MSRVTLNGEPREVHAADLAALASELALPERGVAIARNGEVVPRSRWHETPLHDGDAIELVTAVQGGAL